MATERQERPVGDPAFAGSDAITHEPVVEEERAELADAERWQRPFPWAILATVVAVVALAVVAGVAAGAQYAIPFAVLGALVLGFVAVHRGLAKSKTARYGEGGHDEAAAAGDDPIPHMGFDEPSELGETTEASDAR